MNTAARRSRDVTLLVQPGSGVASLVAAIDRARISVEIAIFRFDIRGLERSLRSAVDRGVIVHALVAQTNRGGAKQLRRLEQRLLDAGVTVSRTANRLIRYHGKYVVIDRDCLWVLGYNPTHADVFHARSLGIVTTRRDVVREARRIFDADATRQPYTSAAADLIVSPENARARLSRFIRGSRTQLLVYDPQASDPKMLLLCRQRARAGVDVRIIGGTAGHSAGLRVRKLAGLHLHVRAIVRDGAATFVGSQSLRDVELDGRREVGIIVRNRRLAAAVQAVFESDWAGSKRVAA